jgi:hypothetical protein
MTVSPTPENLTVNQWREPKPRRTSAAESESMSRWVIRPPYVSLRDREQKILPALSVRVPNQQSSRRGVPIGGYPSPPVKLIPPLASIDQVKKMIAA